MKYFALIHPITSRNDALNAIRTGAAVLAVPFMLEVANVVRANQIPAVNMVIDPVVFIALIAAGFLKSRTAACVVLLWAVAVFGLSIVTWIKLSPVPTITGVSFLFLLVALRLTWATFKYHVLIRPPRYLMDEKTGR